MDFKLYAWGRNNQGQLGVGTNENVFTPKEIGYLNQSIRKISIGANHSILITHSGVIYTCGSNESAQLGHINSQNTFHQVKTLETFNIVDVAAGSQHSLALTDNGTVLSWGSGEKGQLGLGRDRLFSDADDYKSQNTIKPRIIQDFVKSDRRIVQVAAGERHSICLDSYGTVWTFGENGQGQLGIGHYVSCYLPQKVESLAGLPITQIVSGQNHCACMTTGGDIYVWGQNEFGQLGLGWGHVSSQPHPIRVNTPVSMYNIVNIAMGRQHSIALTRDKVVLTTGMGKNGQLGHGASMSEIHWRSVAEFSERPVASIACGRSHSLVLGTNGRVYSFGHGSCGQLGMNTTDSLDTPATIRSLLNGDYVQNVKGNVCSIWAGSDSSFALISDKTITDTPIRPVFMNKDSVMALLETTRIASIMNGSFLGNLDDLVLSAAVDLEGIREIYAVLYETCPSVVQTALTRAVFRLASDLKFLKFESPETLRVFVLIFENPYLLDSDKAFPVLESLISLIPRLPSNASSVLRNWWSNLPLSHYTRVIEVLQRLLSHIVLTQNTSEVNLVTVTIVLNMLCEINVKHERISYTEFYNSHVSALLNPKEAYHTWISHPRVFSFCRFPFLLNADAKARLVKVAAENEMVHHTTHSLMRGFSLSQPVDLVFVLHVRRDHLFEDTLNALLSTSPSEMKKPLRVVFDGEEGVDEGGVRKEFFQLLFHELFTTLEGLFVFDEDSRYVWFGSDSPFATAEHFQLLGTLFGLAIYNSVILEPFFPFAVFKKLLGGKGDISDLQKIFPRIAKSLDELISFDGDVETTFGLTFDISVKRDGKVVTHSLCKCEGKEKEEEKGVKEEEKGVKVEEKGEKVEENDNSSLHPLPKLRKRSAIEMELDSMHEIPTSANGRSRTSVFDTIHLTRNSRDESAEVQSVESNPSVLPSITMENSYDLDQLGATAAARLGSVPGFLDTKSMDGSCGVPVTNDNREEFVSLYTDWLLNESVDEIFESFKLGFLNVVHGKVLSLLRPEELELLVCGSHEYDFHELQKYTRYETPYSPSHPTVIAFWDTFHEFSMEMKRKLLAFVTGSDRVPIMGLSALNFTIRRSGDDKNRLPSSHTCFSLFDLPEYNDKEILRERLVFALQNARGFGII